MSGKAKKSKSSGVKRIAENPKARHNYEIVETYEAGLVLQGTEVKSLREGRATIRESYVRIDDGEGYVYGMNIPVYEFGNIHNHDPDRTRKLLLNKKELRDIDVQVTQKGLSVVPLSLYFSRGKAKLKIGVGRGKQSVDKRKSIAERDVKRQLDRELKQRR